MKRNNALKYGPRYGKMANWDGMKRLYHKGFRTFPSGLLPRIEFILTNARVEFQVEYDTKPWTNWKHYTTDLSGFEQRDYQEAAVVSVMENGRCMVKVATGGGKTYIAARVIAECGMPTVFLVHTKDLMYQAFDVFSQIFGEDRVGLIGDGICKPADITICTIQTAALALDVDYEKYAYSEDEEDERKMDMDKVATVVGVIQDAGVVIMDECHRVAAPTATNVLSAINNAMYRIGLSASPWRDDGADLVLEAVFGQVAVDIPASQLIERGYLVTPYIKFVSVPPVTFPKGTKYATIYEQYIVNNSVRNAIGIRETLSLVKKGKPTMVLVRHIAHGRFIASELESVLGEPVPFLSGKDDSDTRNRTIQGMRDGTVKLLVATTIADEGLDIRPLEGLVLLGGGKSSTRALQRVGRVLRTYGNKKNAVVIDFDDKARFLADHSKKRQQIYEAEPSFVITDV